MGKIIDKIPKKHQEEMLGEIVGHYVDQQGLSAMPKRDFDALLVHLFLKYANVQHPDCFELSELFKTTEARLKNLLELAAVKYDTDGEVQAWSAILEKLGSSKFEVESLEKGDLRFKLEHPGHFRFVQMRFRRAGATITYSKASETAKTSLSSFLQVLNSLVKDQKDEEMKTKLLDGVSRTLMAVAGSLGKDRLEKLAGEEEKSTLLQHLDTGSKLASIGAAVKTVFFSLV